MKQLISKLMLVALSAMTFVACEDVPEPYDIPGTGVNIPGTTTELEGATGTGTLADPFNAIAAINYGKTLASGEESAAYYYVKGKVVSIKEEFTTQYGNGTFYISEDGTASNQFYAYRVKYLGNQGFAASDEQIKVGDEVVICGIITNYNGTIETAQNKGFLYSLNGVNRGGEPKESTPAAEPSGNGTQASPYNVSAVLQYIGTLGTEESPQQVYVKGKVTRVTEEFTTQYGNATFYISDDGEQSNEFYAYRVKYLGNKSFASGDTQIKKGDEVIVCGNVVNYRSNTPETVQNKAYLYSLNGKTDGGGETPTPQPSGEAKGSGTLDDPFNVQAIINYVSALSADVDTKQDYYVKGIVTNIPSNGISTQYNNISFYISDDKSASNKFYIFRAKGLNGGDITENMLKVGDEVVVFGSTWVNYRGNTPETKQGEAYIVSIKAGEGGGDTPDNPGGEVSGNSITVDFTAQGFANAEDVTSLTLTDGTTITFSTGDNRNGPKYYNSGTAVRMYPKNSFTVSSSKTLASIALTCSANNAEGQVTASPGTVSVNDMDVTISAINANTTTVTDAHTGTGAASQLRISKMVITYAE